MANELEKQPIPAEISIEDYLTNRVKNQMDWYAKKSRELKSWHNRLKIWSISFAALIPILLLWPTYGNQFWADFLRVLAALFGAKVAAIESVQSFKKYAELAASYRTTKETLQRELLHFQTKSGDYESFSDEKALFIQFVNRCELIMTGENRNWLAIAKPVEKPADKKND